LGLFFKSEKQNLHVIGNIIAVLRF